MTAAGSGLGTLRPTPRAGRSTMSSVPRIRWLPQDAATGRGAERSVRYAGRAVSSPSGTESTKEGLQP